MYASKVKRDLARWVDAGLLPAETAAALARDLDGRTVKFGIGQLLLILAAVFFSAALLMVVAANWEIIPRIARLGAVIALIWLCHLAAAHFLRTGRPVFGAAALLLGTATFGGGLSLAGQMYHISGDMVSMFTVWFAAAVLTSVLFRSGAVAVAAGFLAFALCWSILDVNYAGVSLPTLLVPLALAAVMAALARWSGQEKAAHFSFLLALGWVVWLYAQYDTPLTAVFFVLVGFVLFVGLSLQRSPLRRFGEMLGGVPPLYALLIASIGLLILHVELEGAALIGAAVAGLSIAVAALALGGRDHGGVRWLSYAIIASVIFYLWIETVGSILGTSGFFLVAALVAGGLAFAVTRIEKRLSARGRLQ